jgi:hypothetical protein
MATNRNEPWGECELLSSRKISEEEVEELRHKMFGTCSWEESIKDTINRLIQEGANIKNDNGLLIMDMDTLIKIIEEYSYE